MDYVRLGNTGLKVSRICLGTMTYGSSQWRDWVLDEEASRPFIQRALELGITFFDPADVYSLGESERIVGRALKDYAKRHEVILATKGFNPMSDDVNDRGLSRKHIMDAIDASLQRLGTDYVDLVQIHRFDPETPVEETMEALHDVVKAGKARYIGASSMYPGSSPRCSTPPSVTAGRASSPCRTTTTWSTARRARDDPAVRRSGRRADPLESAGTRLPGREPYPGQKR
jgi:aryl-alcohol dehydrogenase (NADP+)